MIGTSMRSSSSSAVCSRSAAARVGASPGSGTAAIEPSIPSGAGGGTPRALHSRSRPRRASERFVAMNPVQPSSSSPPT